MCDTLLLLTTNTTTSPNSTLDDLKQTLEGMVDVLFPGVEKRWNEDYFPFTEPSLELEVFYEGAWLEVSWRHRLLNIHLFARLPTKVNSQPAVSTSTSTSPHPHMSRCLVAEWCTQKCFPSAVLRSATDGLLG